MKREMRNGFTTGSCAAAASRAAAVMLFTGEQIEEISLEVPTGDVFRTKIFYVNIKNGLEASCAVLKDGGDDPDVTTGLYIYSRVKIEGDDREDCSNIMLTESDVKPSPNDVMLTKNEVYDNNGIMLTEVSRNNELIIDIDGGEGIGRVTKPGLDRAVGEAAINSVPRRMIAAAVRSEAVKAGFSGRLSVLIYAPGGDRIAPKTFNPRLGITGGISILGTSGVEEPMSTRALIDTIKVEMKVHRAQGEDIVAVTPGNYGREFMLKKFGYDLERSVKCSNYIGDSIRIAAELGFKEMLLTGHIGKLIKLTGGISNTHSSNADCRMELICAAALRAGCSGDTGRAVLDCISAEEALKVIDRDGRLDRAMKVILSGVIETLDRISGGEIKTECMIYSNELGLLSESSNAGRLLERLRGVGSLRRSRDR